MQPCCRKYLNPIGLLDISLAVGRENRSCWEVEGAHGNEHLLS